MSREICPLCGAVSLTPGGETAPLLAVADYLVERALCGVSALLTRGRAFGVGRGVVAEVRARGYSEESAWLVVGAPPAAVDKAIAGRTDDWRVIALMLDDRSSFGISARRVQAVLTDYVHDIVADKRPHSVETLRLKMHHDLGITQHDFEDAPLARMQA